LVVADNSFKMDFEREIEIGEKATKQERIAVMDFTYSG